MNIGDFSHHLLGVRKSGAGFVSRCPAHDDKEPSLSFRGGDQGGIVVKCHAGCETEQIVAAIGLRLSDLMPENGSGPVPLERRKIAEHVYRDKAGVVMYVRDRFNTGQKISQRRPDPAGGWVHNLDGIPRTIYRLDKLAADTSSTVFWVEGEKCVEALEGIGFLATTSGGAESWTKELAAHLDGRDVVIIPDNDAPGRKHAEAVLAGLSGHARSVRILDLGLEDKGADIADWIAAGGTPEALLDLMAEGREGELIEGGECARRFVVGLEMRADGRIKGIKSGIPPLDEILRGFRPGNMYIVCGETSNGKTLVGVHAAISMAKAGVRVGFISLEMPLQEIETRFVCHLTGNSFQEVEDCFTTGGAEMVANVMAAAKTRATLPIAVLDGSGVTIRQLAEQCRAFKKAKGLDIVIVDYVQYLSDDTKRGGTREQEMTRVSNGCKAMAKREKIPVVVMAQLRRRDVRNEDHRPTLERLRETGAFEQDSSGVVGIYWPHRYGEEGFAWHDAELWILKNRNGPCDKLAVTVDWASGADSVTPGRLQNAPGLPLVPPGATISADPDPRVTPFRTPFCPGILYLTENTAHVPARGRIWTRAEVEFLSRPCFERDLALLVRAKVLFDGVIGDPGPELWEEPPREPTRADPRVESKPTSASRQTALLF